MKVSSFISDRDEKQEQSLEGAKRKAAMLFGVFVSFSLAFFKTQRGREKRAPGQGLWAYLEHYCHREEIVSKHPKLLQLSL